MDEKGKVIELNSVSFMEANFIQGEKQRISPIGDVIGVDGRGYKIDGNKIIAKAKEIGLDIVLNENHWGSKAYGWFDLNSLELKSDGIYASLELNSLGKPVVEDKQYRYLSPEFMVDRERNVISIVGVGLVNQPNLLNKALNNQEENSKDEEQMDEELKKKLEKQIEDNNVALKDKDDQIKTLTDSLKTTKVDNAIASGTMLPASKEFALGLELNQIDGYISTLNTKPQTDGMQKELNIQQQQENNSASETLVFDQLGIEGDK